MAQHDYNIANQGFPAFRTDLNNVLSAINTLNSGTSRPASAVAGSLWLDTTSATAPILKYYDGADDITLATINHSANTVDFNDSAISTPLAVTGNATAGAEIRLPEDTDNGTNYVALKAPDTIASNLTLTLPSADGTSGQVLQTNGSGVLSFVSASAGLAFQSAIKTSNFTAVAGEGYFCNTTSSAFTVTLPASPSIGNQVAIVDYAGTFATNKITLGANGNKIQSQTSDVIVTKKNQALTLTYTDATSGWLVSSAANEGSGAVGISYSSEFLVLAGGGGGGANQAGGGGAGGYRNSYSTETSGGGGSSESSITFATGIVYTITVGAGGTAGIDTTSDNGDEGVNGSASSITGTAFTSIISDGGGGGGGGGTSATSANGILGGSGGGGGGRGSKTGGSGTANQGYAGGTSASGDAGGTSHGGGGGGASAVGGNASTSAAGNGGNGLASSITGSSVTRGGGGSGGGAVGGGTAGTGGGGTGGVTNVANSSVGSVNTGGGGGGGQGGAPGAAGGSGVVILRMATANYSGITTGSPTVTTSGSDTILVYNSSGSYTG